MRFFTLTKESDTNDGILDEDDLSSDIESVNELTAVSTVHRAFLMLKRFWSKFFECRLTLSVGVKRIGVS